MTFLRINLPQTLHFFASLLGETLLHHLVPLALISFGGTPLPKKYLRAFPLDYTTGLITV